MDQKLKDLARYAKAKDIPSFIIFMKNENLLTTHFENVKRSDAMTLIIAGFNQVIDMELESQPKDAPMRGSLEALKRDVGMAIEACNRRALGLLKDKK